MFGAGSELYLGIDPGFAPDIKTERSRSPARPFLSGSNPDYRSRAAPSCGRPEDSTEKFEPQDGDIAELRL